jgi:membrane protein implicated in regulation of membrane protease activity
VVGEVQEQGYVRVAGALWKAASQSGEPIPAGRQVTVNRIEGMKLFVTPLPGPRDT